MAKISCLLFVPFFWSFENSNNYCHSLGTLPLHPRFNPLCFSCEFKKATLHKKPNGCSLNVSETKSDFGGEEEGGGLLEKLWQA